MSRAGKICYKASSGRLYVVNDHKVKSAQFIMISEFFIIFFGAFFFNK